MVRDYASALVPDFMEFYGLRLVEAIDTMHPVEVLLLISGLPHRSRYAARLVGEETGVGWTVHDWLALDTRNALEGLRSTVINALSGKDKKAFRDWTAYPGYKSDTDKARDRAVATLRAIAQPVTE